MKKSPWLFFIIFVLCFFYSNLIRISGVVVLPALMDKLSIGAGMVGFLSSLFFYTYGASFAPWGAVLDRFGAFRACGAAMLVAAAGAFMLMSAESALWVGIGRAVSGLGLSCAFSGVLIYSSSAFPKDSYPSLVSISFVVGHSGTVAAVAPLGVALDILGTGGVYLALGLFALTLGALLLFFRNDDPECRKDKSTREPFSAMSLPANMKAGAKIVWRSFPLRVTALTWGVCAALMSTLQGLWAVTWLESAAGAAANDARACATWISAGMVVGPLIGGWVTKKARGGKVSFFVMCALTELAWLAWILATAFSVSLNLLAVIGFLIGLTAGAAMVFMGNATRDLSPEGYVGVVLGLVNTTIYLMVILFQWGTGLFIELLSDSLPGYPQLGYQAGFALLLVLQGYFFSLILKVKSFLPGE